MLDRSHFQRVSVLFPIPSQCLHPGTGTLIAWLPWRSQLTRDSLTAHLGVGIRWLSLALPLLLVVRVLLPLHHSLHKLIWSWISCCVQGQLLLAQLQLRFSCSLSGHCCFPSPPLRMLSNNEQHPITSSQGPTLCSNFPLFESAMVDFLPNILPLYQGLVFVQGWTSKTTGAECSFKSWPIFSHSSCYS